jgi:hypothetical protein
MCSSSNCDDMAAWHFECGGVGSYYCQRCSDRIKANQQKFDAKEANYTEFSGARRGDLPGWRNRQT